jgi:GGDEF domain-containing protein
MARAAGNEVLESVAEVTRRIARNADWRSRHRGDEFAVLFVANVVEKANVVAERIGTASEGERRRLIKPRLCPTIFLGRMEATKRKS